MRPIAILTLDIATRTGWALARPDGPPASGVYRANEGGNRLGYVLFKFSEWLTDFLAANRVRRVYYEAPLFMFNQRDGEQKTTQETVFRLMAMAGVAITVAESFGIEADKLHHQQVKKFFAGSGHAKPEAVIKACFDRGWRPTSDDDADALAMLAYAEHVLGIKRDHGPMFRAA